ncbi:hypothetical protein MKZ38_008835 [Zalerion maritima]|uniref:Swiss Army Knife RNA repair protein HAD domain-containing protein n=1 Tax=Zalerion maritima TaxID=339359 RepID=A0AAD5WTT3_9PEZI|nr:hypothetical protein MKZ38_008835 [Zalerion maritima]
MGSTYANGNAPTGPQGSKVVYTPTSLGRWSIASIQLPPVDSIRAIHVYDFDNTRLFPPPQPSDAAATIHHVQIDVAEQLSIFFFPAYPSLTQRFLLDFHPDMFVAGGWWHNNRFLSAVGDGIEKEESRGWEGWWNERVVKLVKLSMEQPDALTVLLTGRAETGFADLLKRIVKSKGLEFDMIGLKPTVGPNNERFSSTMNFKQAFLTAILETYKHASEMAIYEDRIKHVKQFQNFLDSFNANLMGKRRTLARTEVFHVQELAASLDPVVEVAEVQQLINCHNEQVTNPLPGTTPHSRGPLALKKSVFFTAYMISPTDSQRLLTLPKLPSHAESDLKILANSILICPRPCPEAILKKVGGMGSKMMWEVTGTGNYEGNLWAASLRPVQPNVSYHTENNPPLVVLALRRGARPFDAGRIQNWKSLPADKRFQFETTVNEKVVLRIEAEGSDDDDAAMPTKPRNKRKHPTDEEYARNSHGSYPGKNDRGGQSGRSGRAGFRGGAQSNRGSKNSSRGNAGRGGRGRGGHGYRSLDDVEPKGAHAHTGQYGFPAAVYDDEPTQPQRPVMGGQQPPTQPANFNQQLFSQQGQQQQLGGGAWQTQPPTGPSQNRGGPANGNSDALGSYY